MAKTAKWKKVDTHDGVTLARCKFGRGSPGHAVIKVEGVLAADPATVYQFLQLTTREGGKVSTEQVRHWLPYTETVNIWQTWNMNYTIILVYCLNNGDVQ